MPSIVVLPAPLGPIIPTIDPAGTWISTPSAMTTVPIRFTMLLASNRFWGLGEVFVKKL
jgi:hypothetical protein